MSLAFRQRTCPVCGKEIREDDSTDFETLIDPVARVVLVHSGESTYVGENVGSVS